MGAGADAAPANLYVRTSKSMKAITGLAIFLALFLGDAPTTDPLGHLPRRLLGL